MVCGWVGWFELLVEELQCCLCFGLLLVADLDFVRCEEVVVLFGDVDRFVGCALCGEFEDPFVVWV